MQKRILTNFNHSKHQGQTGSILYCYRKVGINWKDITMSFFKHAWDTAMCHWHGKKAQAYFSPNWERKARMITLTSFQLKWLEKLVLYHINEDSNVQAKLFASQYGFRAGVATEIALHEFVRRVEHCLVWKKPPLGIFLDIVGAFDNVTFIALLRFCEGWAYLRFSPHG